MTMTDNPDFKAAKQHAIMATEVYPNLEHAMAKNICRAYLARGDVLERARQYVEMHKDDSDSAKKLLAEINAVIGA